MEDKTIFQLKYLVMPDYIYSDDRLTDVSRRVYSFIHSYKNPFYFGNEHLAKMFKCHEQTISTAMGQLEELGLILVAYKVKAGGGKIRLCVDAHSDGVSTLSRKKKVEATNESLHSDKVLKDNNVMSENFEINEEDFKDKAWLEAREARKEKKRLGNTTQGRVQISPLPYKKNGFEVKEKVGAHGEDIV